MIPIEIIKKDVLSWIKEDIVDWDVSTIPTNFDKIIKAKIIAKQVGIIGGLTVAKVILELYNLNYEVFVKEGDKVSKGDILFQLEGESRIILSIERTLLNIFSHMSGIATLTHNILLQIKSINPQIILAGTRKTLPGLRNYQKWAITIGGGDPHRMTLSSMVMLKENHIHLLGGVKEAIIITRSKISFTNKIEVEVQNLEEAIIAAENQADIIMLDNFSPDDVKIAIPKLRDINPKVLIEISGNLNENNISDYLSNDINIVSMGKLTHSSTVFDMSLLFYD
ncbi:MAG: carboxylating nicotinate-nucleotide diphosphorylase [Candidatus Heimdallarchaeota archaeon]|nr:carboxylating nicotinate-nucleotide diphosphorylase [Candidatus Heimdallarchaeota archaeon]